MNSEQLKELIRTAPVLQGTLDGLDAALATSSPDVDAMRVKRNGILESLRDIDAAKQRLAELIETPVAEAATDEPVPVAEVVDNNET